VPEQDEDGSDRNEPTARNSKTGKNQPVVFEKVRLSDDCSTAGSESEPSAEQKAGG